MGRPSKGPRLWLDPISRTWIIRDGAVFIRTGNSGWAGAEKKFVSYLEAKPGKRVLPKPEAEGVVYFVTAEWPDFPIKIGFTERMNTVRLQGLQVGCPYKLTWLACFRGKYQDESKLHRQFAADRLTGEWFKRSPELMAAIERCTLKEAA